MSKKTYFPVDLRIKDAKRKAEGMRSERLCWQIGQVDPTTHETDGLVRELLCGKIGPDSRIHPPLFINLGNRVRVGNHVTIMNGLHVMAAGGVTIEDHVRIALGCTIVTNNHDLKERDILLCAPVVIRENAWIGANVTILPGVTIGRNAVIGAGSIVTRDVPDNVMAAGNPARILRVIDEA